MPAQPGQVTPGGGRVAGGEQLTPTAKVKRGEVAVQYQAVIDGLYG